MGKEGRNTFVQVNSQKFTSSDRGDKSKIIAVAGAKNHVNTGDRSLTEIPVGGLSFGSEQRIFAKSLSP